MLLRNVILLICTLSEGQTAVWVEEDTVEEANEFSSLLGLVSDGLQSVQR